LMDVWTSRVGQAVRLWLTQSAVVGRRDRGSTDGYCSHLAVTPIGPDAFVVPYVFAESPIVSGSKMCDFAYQIRDRLWADCVISDSCIFSVDFIKDGATLLNDA
jgi:hypothetical protein